MNFNCIFPNCTFKNNNVDEEVFQKHLDEFHNEEIMQISKKRENLSSNDQNDRRFKFNCFY